MKVTVLLALLLLTCGLAACSTQEPRPAAPPLPPRPFSVALDDVSLCDTLTSAQENRLRIGDANDGIVNVNGKLSPVCTWLGDDGVDFNVQIIDLPASTALTEVASKVVAVGQFGGVETTSAETTSGKPLCQVTIDAAPDRSVRVQALSRPSGPTPGIGEQCRRASDVASEVMTTLATASR